MATILIIDDEPACRLPLSRLLQIEGYDVKQAGDGLEALQRLDEQKTDLILLDLLMPRMDGVAFLERLRADARYAQLPVFLVTANHDPVMLDKAKSLGIQQYLFKGDIQFARMLELVKTALGEPFTPVRRGRRPKNPQATPPKHDGNGAAPAASKERPPREFEAVDDDEPAEFLHD